MVLLFHSLGSRGCVKFWAKLLNGEIPQAEKSHMEKNLGQPAASTKTPGESLRAFGVPFDYFTVSLM